MTRLAFAVGSPAAIRARPVLPLAGYRVLYRPGVTCPCCAGHAWHVGRQSAECAGCATALPLAPVHEVRHG